MVPLYNTYTIEHIGQPRMDLGGFIARETRTGPRKVKRKDVAKRRSRNKAARQSRRKNG